ncbi:MAG: exosortase system-associated protein, TIGR04073 family [Verrucomicrobiota bacterium]
MKKCILITLIVGFAGLAYADIQAPPGARLEPGRKLSRAFANILYGVGEIPNTWNRRLATGDASAAFAEAVVRGSFRGVCRLGYGAYELVTFPFPTYKGSYRAPYNNLAYDPNHGFAEYPPEFGFKSASPYSRLTPY